MATKKPAAGKTDKRGSDAQSVNSSAAVTSAHSTVGEPARSDTSKAKDAATKKASGAQELAAAMPFNANKAGEYGAASADPAPGATAEPADPRVTGSSLTENILSPKVGAGKPNLGFNPGNLPLDRVRVDSMPSVLFDAMAVPGGKSAVVTLGNVGHALEFIKDQYRHAKPILALGVGAELVESADAPVLLTSRKPDPGMLVGRQANATEARPLRPSAVIVITSASSIRR